MRKLDDLDIGFSLGTVFGMGITGCCVATAAIVRTCKRLRSAKIAQKRLFNEIDRDLENEENESF